MEINVGRVLDALPAMVWTALPDGSIDYVNGAWSDYTGVRPGKIDKWEWRALVDPDDLPGLVERWQSILASSRPGEIEARLRRYDGEYRWFLVRVSPLRDKSGDLVKWCGVNIDIDNRKLAEQAITRSERDLKLMIDTIPVLAWSADPDGKAQFLSQYYLNYVGFSAEEARERGWTGAVHPEDAAKLEAVWLATLASGTRGECELRMRRYDGQYRWFLFRVDPLRDDAGTIVKWYGVHIGIEFRKQALEKLRRSEAFLAEGQHLARMGNLSWHVAKGEIVWSEPLYRIFEFEPDSVVTLDLIASRVHPEDIPLMEDMLEAAERGESHFEYQHRIVLPDQSVKHLHVVAHRIEDRSGQTEYIGAVLDITQRRHSEDALEKVRSELAKVTRIMSLGVLTASIAHEVNQPLSGIITNASTCLRMLATDPPNIEIAKETARRTIRDGNRAADVVGRLRALFSKRTAMIERLDLNEAVREVIALASGEFQRNCVVLCTELACGLPFVAGDRIQLQQVVMNLLRNAADAMSGVTDRQRRLQVRTEVDTDNCVRLSVQDAGAGFGTDSLERLFEPFYTTKSDGMGIGLSVSRSIIECHNGRLWALSNDGPGATFSFAIPVYSGDEVPLPEISVSRAPDGSAHNAGGFHDQRVSARISCR